jgi:hypothetical protein
MIGVSASIFNPVWFDTDEIATLTTAIESGGVNLFVAKLDADHDVTTLVQLTHGAILGAESPLDRKRDWFVTTEAPEITQEFTGQSIDLNRTLRQKEHAITLNHNDQVIPLITSTDDTRNTYPIFVTWPKGSGQVFVDAGANDGNLDEMTFRDMYFDKPMFTEIIPLMFAMRSCLFQEVWHSYRDYANLTIDDPPLQNNMGGTLQYIDYHKLLAEMNLHQFHTTIAFIPKNWDDSDPDVVQLFLENPDNYSLVQHGNNSDGFEFFKYSAAEEDKWPSRPFEGQEEDIVEGLQRMELHTSQTGIPFDRIMIFPYGNAPAPTLGILKRHNYLALVQGAPQPLGEPCSKKWDYLMVPANFECENYPMVRRLPIPDKSSFDPLWPVYRLFLDRPALINSHVGEMFGTGINSFNSIADHINSLYGNVEWKSLGETIRRLYWERQNDDGSVDLRMFSNNWLIVTNETDEPHTYHVSKEETLNVPINSLTVNGHEFPYDIQDGYLSLSAILPAYETMEIVIEYEE